MQSENLKDRKPAKRVADVPPDVAIGLVQGELESKNLSEWLSIDRIELLRHLNRSLNLGIAIRDIERLAEDTVGLAALKRSQAVAKFLRESIEVGDEHWRALSTHTSDVAREWSALILGLSKLPFQKKLAWVKPLADDPNSGVREIAWIALRGDVIEDPQEAVRRLVPWTGSRSPNLRRYASEITRPRGVWASHVEVFKKSPEMAIELLEPLKSDEAKYVKDSVGNWLNDASKTSPDWVRDLARRWETESPTKETAYILRRALRTVQS